MERPPRRRRRPEEAEREILDAAESLFARLPADEVTVSAIMGATTLSRKSFYVYFRDRRELIVRLVARLRAKADAALARFAKGDQDFLLAGRGTLRAVAELYAEHGEILRALGAAGARDPEAAEAWRSFVEPVRAAMIERVGAEVEAGRVTGIDVAPTVTALMSMNVARFLEELAGRPGADIDGVVDQLHLIWIRTLYGRLPDEVARAIDRPVSEAAR